MAAGSQEATGKRILVVEDEWFIAQNLVADLRAMNLIVVGPAPSIVDALALVVAEQIEGAVLAITLRDGLVFPVADALATQGVPFVFAIDYEAEAIPERYRAVPRYDKPADVRTLIAALVPA